MSVMTYPDVLQAVQQLSPEIQLELAETLLHNLRSLFVTPKARSPEPELAPLIGLNHAELQALADAVAAPEHQQQLQMLLAKNRQGKLTPEEEKILDRLLAEADQVALLKARALYTLKRSAGVETN